MATTMITRKRPYDEAFADPEFVDKDPVPQRFFKRAKIRCTIKPVQTEQHDNATTAELIEQIRMMQTALENKMKHDDTSIKQHVDAYLDMYCGRTMPRVHAFDGSRVYTKDEVSTIVQTVLAEVTKLNDDSLQLFRDRFKYLLDCVEAPNMGDLSYIS